jgi:hypothetical protein
MSTTAAASHNIGTHTSTAGADAYVDVASAGGQSVTGITYGGVAMTLVRSNVIGNAAWGYACRYRLTNVTGGPQTIIVNTSGACNIIANCTSVKGVTSMGAFQTGTTGSKNVTCTAGQLILHSFYVILGNLGASPAGGTVHYVGNLPAGGMSIHTATATTTFTASHSGTAIVSISNVLS